MWDIVLEESTTAPSTRCNPISGIIVLRQAGGEALSYLGGRDSSLGSRVKTKIGLRKKLDGLLIIGNESHKILVNVNYVTAFHRMKINPSHMC